MTAKSISTQPTTLIKISYNYARTFRRGGTFHQH